MPCAQGALSRFAVEPGASPSARELERRALHFRTVVRPHLQQLGVPGSFDDDWYYNVRTMKKLEAK